MDHQEALFYIYSTIFLSTLDVSNDRVVHHQEFYRSVLYYTALYNRANVSSCFGLTVRTTVLLWSYSYDYSPALVLQLGLQSCFGLTVRTTVLFWSYS